MTASTAPWILGGAQTDFAQSWSKGQRLVDLLRAVVPPALDEAGLEADALAALRDDDRIAFFVGNFDGQEWTRQGHLGAWAGEVDEVLVGVRGARFECACASGAMALDAARARVAAGELDVAIVAGAEIMRNTDAATIGDYLGTCADYREEADGVDYVFPKLFGDLAERVIELSEAPEGRIVDALTKIARTNYAHAKNNPDAQSRRWDIDGEHMQKRSAHLDPLLGGRTRYIECSQITDGAACVIVAAPQWARAHGVAAGDVSAIAGHGHRTATLRMAPKLAVDAPGELLPWTRRAIAEAMCRAEVTIADVDVVETHDCFAISEYVALSAFGIADAGHEYRAVEEGAIARGGRLPVNPSGGLIGAGHPVGASGVRMALDLHRQVTGTAGDYQVECARTGAMLNIGGSFTTNLSFVVTRAAG